MGNFVQLLETRDTMCIAYLARKKMTYGVHSDRVVDTAQDLPGDEEAYLISAMALLDRAGLPDDTIDEIADVILREVGNRYWWLEKFDKYLRLKEPY